MTSHDPRRRERIVGAVVVLIGVGVLVLSVVALLDARSTGASAAGTVTLPTARASASGSSGSASPSPSPGGSGGAGSSGSRSASSSAGTAVTKLPLVVLNNTTTSGLAQQAAATFGAGGWTVSGTGNLTDTIKSTCAYYDPTVTGAQAAATALQGQFPAIKRTAVKFAGLPAGPVVVVLTSDYTST